MLVRNRPSVFTSFGDIFGSEFRTNHNFHAPLFIFGKRARTRFSTGPVHSMGVLKMVTLIFKGSAVGLFEIIVGFTVSGRINTFFFQTTG